MPRDAEILIAACAGGTTCPQCGEPRLVLCWERDGPTGLLVKTRTETHCGCRRILREHVVYRTLRQPT